nr:MAG TPA: MCC J25-L, LINEAR FORM OF PEPTIDE [Caudoviricetes sp.]
MGEKFIYRLKVGISTPLFLYGAGSVGDETTLPSSVTNFPFLKYFFGGDRDGWKENKAFEK